MIAEKYALSINAVIHVKRIINVVLNVVHAPLRVTHYVLADAKSM
jgi:hypothetical protein